MAARLDLDGDPQTGAVRPLSILIRLRRMQLSGVARQAARDPVGAATLAFLLLGLVVGLRSALTREPANTAWRFGLELAATAGMAAVLHRAVVGPDGARLTSGPLHPVLVRAGVLASWSRLQVLVLVGAPAAVLASTLSPDVGRALALLAATACGVGTVPPSRGTVASATNASRASARGSLTGPLLVARTQALGRGSRSTPVLLAVGFVVLGAGAGRLALLSNPGPQIAGVVLAVAGLAAGSVIGAVDVGLVRFLGRTPVRLASLLAASCLPGAACAATALVAAALLIGLGPAFAFATADAVGGALASTAGLSALHALGGRPTYARLAALLDLALIGLVTFAPAAPVWAAVRTASLWRAAGSERWLST